MIVNENGVELRNLQEQVQKNKEDIADYYNSGRVLADFGIRVIGQVASESILPFPGAFEGDYGDAYAVGPSEPYSFYIWTRADPDSGHPDDYWFNIGQLAIVGPQGPQGIQGIRGPQGYKTQILSLSSLPNTAALISQHQLRNGDFCLPTDQPGKLFRLDMPHEGNFTWRYIQNFMGPKGVPGQNGAPGAPGEPGRDGERGPQGDVGGFINIHGILDNQAQLPTPASLGNLTIAYLVGTTAPYDLYIQVGSTSAEAVWTNTGGFNAATLVYDGGVAQNVWDADTKVDKITEQSKVYATNNQGQQTSIQYNKEPLGSDIPLRTSDGRVKTSTPTEANDSVPKSYADTYYLPKWNTTITLDSVLAKKISSSEYEPVYINSIPTADALVRYTADGCLKVNDPIEDNDAAHKKYVDDAETDAKNYADTQDETVLSSAHTYADDADAIILQSAKDYADTQDATTLQDAKDYSDAKDAIQDANLDNLKIRVSDLEHTSNDFVEDATEAYIKDVPAGASSMALMTEIGGKTRKCENIFDISKISNVGTQLVNNGDGTIICTKANGSFVGSPNQSLASICPHIIAGETYYLNADTSDNITNKRIKVGSEAWDFGTSKTLTQDLLDAKILIFGGNDDTAGTISNIIISKENIPYEPYFEGLRDTKVTEVKPKCRNLFDYEAFLAENDATKADDGFWDSGVVNKTIFINYGIKERISIRYTGINNSPTGGIPILFCTYYTDGSASYNAGIPEGNTGIVDVQATSDVGKNVDYIVWQFQSGRSFRIKDVMINIGAPTDYVPYKDLPPLPIPAEVQALEGYGKSYTKLDFENFTNSQNTVTYVGTEPWAEYVDGENNDIKEVFIDVSNIIRCYHSEETINSVNNKFEDVTRTNVYYGTKTGLNCSGNFIRINWEGTVDEWKAQLATWNEEGNPLTITYRTDEIQSVTPVSQYFPNDGWLEVEGGGSIIFENEHKQAPKSVVNFMVPKSTTPATSTNEEVI